MKEEKFLVKYNEGIFSKIAKFMKRFFGKFNKNNENEKQNSSCSSLDDMEILKNIMDGEVEIKDLDDELKNRLLNLCNNRLDEVNQKINERKIENNKIERLLIQISNL